MRMLLFLFLSFTAFACGPKGPKELLSPDKNPHPECEHNAHFFAKGTGDTPGFSD